MADCGNFVYLGMFNHEVSRGNTTGYPLLFNKFKGCPVGISRPFALIHNHSWLNSPSVYDTRGVKEKTVEKRVKIGYTIYMKRSLRGITAVLIFLMFTGCYDDYREEYHVYYYGAGNTSGQPPVDPKVYFTEDIVTVAAASPDMKKGDYEFLGWRWPPSPETVFKAGDTITMNYDDIRLYALWDGDGESSLFTYEIDTATQEASITKYNGIYYQDTVHIPDAIEGKPITRIGNDAFRDTYVNIVTFPESLRYIGETAFYNCGLSWITIPDSVESIGTGAFQFNSVTEITLGTGLTAIAPYVFANNELTLVSLPGIKAIGEGAFFSNTVRSVIIDANVDIKSDNALGTYGGAFRTHYASKGKASGVYVYNAGVWTGPFTK
jgi:hypothetical protein